MYQLVKGKLSDQHLPVTMKTTDSYFPVTIQMKATEQYFPVVLFIMLYKVVLILSLWMKS